MPSKDGFTDLNKKMSEEEKKELIEKEEKRVEKEKKIEEDKQKYLTLQVLFSFINFVVGRPIRIVDNIIIRMVRQIRTVIGPDKWKTFSGGM